MRRALGAGACFGSDFLDETRINYLEGDHVAMTCEGLRRSARWSGALGRHCGLHK